MSGQLKVHVHVTLSPSIRYSNQSDRPAHLVTLHHVRPVHLLIHHPDDLGMPWVQMVEALSTFIVDGQFQGINGEPGGTRPSLTAIFSMPKEGASLPFACSLNQTSEAYFAIVTSVERLTDAATAGKLLSKPFEMPAAGQDLQVSRTSPPMHLTSASWR